MGEVGDDLRLRQTAMQIALQLPNDQVEALLVLKYVEELRGYLAGKGLPDPPPRSPLRLV